MIFANNFCNMFPFTLYTELSSLLTPYNSPISSYLRNPKEAEDSYEPHRWVISPKSKHGSRAWARG